MHSTPDIADNYPDKVVCLHHDWRSFGARQYFSGPVSTVACFEDNSRVAEAVAEPGAGRVLFVDGGGSCHRALLGDRLAALAATNGWAGIVVYGAIRDIEVIKVIDVGVLALRPCPFKTEKRGVGERDVTLTIDGVTIAPGMWMYVDSNGVLVAESRL